VILILIWIIDLGYGLVRVTRYPCSECFAVVGGTEKIQTHKFKKKIKSQHFLSGTRPVERRHMKRKGAEKVHNMQKKQNTGYRIL